MIDTRISQAKLRLVIMEHKPRTTRYVLCQHSAKVEEKFETKTAEATRKASAFALA